MSVSLIGWNVLVRLVDESLSGGKAAPQHAREDEVKGLRPHPFLLDVVDLEGAVVGNPITA